MRVKGFQNGIWALVHLFSVYHQRDYIAQILVRSRLAQEPLCYYYFWTKSRQHLENMTMAIYPLTTNQ